MGLLSTATSSVEGGYYVRQARLTIERPRIGCSVSQQSAVARNGLILPLILGLLSTSHSVGSFASLLVMRYIHLSGFINSRGSRTIDIMLTIGRLLAFLAMLVGVLDAGLVSSMG